MQKRKRERQKEKRGGRKDIKRVIKVSGYGD
jgi:hypothetical protein